MQLWPHYIRHSGVKGSIIGTYKAIKTDTEKTIARHKKCVTIRLIYKK